MAEASIPPETMKHSPYFRNSFRLSRKISQVTLFRLTFPPKMSFGPPKFLMTYCFSHRLKTSQFSQKIAFSPFFFFSKHVHFLQKRHPLFHVLKFSSPLKCKQDFFPP